jgi:hypothetical protein
MKRLLAIGVVLALVGVMAAPMAAMAAGNDTGNSTVTGDLTATYTVTAPATISLGPFALIQQYQSGDTTITVSTTDPSSTECVIKVKDANEDLPNQGKMKNGADYLTNAIQVKGGEIVSYDSLTTEKTLDTITLASGSGSLANVSVAQTIDGADFAKAHGTYALTLVFTGTFN